MTDSTELYLYAGRYNKYLYMNFPTDGYLSIRNSNSPMCNYVEFLFDKTLGTTTSDVSDYSGSLSKGQHYVYLCNIDSNQTTTVSYTFYPTCRVTCMDETKAYAVGSYTMSYSSSDYIIPTGYTGIKGYVVNHWFTDSGLTDEVTIIDKMIGKDW